MLSNQVLLDLLAQFPFGKYDPLCEDLLKEICFMETKERHLVIEVVQQKSCYMTLMAPTFSLSFRLEFLCYNNETLHIGLVSVLQMEIRSISDARRFEAHYSTDQQRICLERDCSCFLLDYSFKTYRIFFEHPVRACSSIT